MLRRVTVSWFIWALSGLSGLSGFFGLSGSENEINEINQIDQIPATRRSMCDYETWTHFLGAAMFIPGA